MEDSQQGPGIEWLGGELQSQLEKVTDTGFTLSYSLILICKIIVAF